jgi:hypothetical protein
MTMDIDTALQPAVTKACPFCGEQIQGGAIKCRYCGRFLDTQMRNARESEEQECAQPEHTGESRGPVLTDTPLSDPNRFSEQAIRFLGVVVTLVILNVVAVGGQKLWHHGEKVKLETLKAQLDAQHSEITQREAELKVFGATSDQSAVTIAGLRTRADRIEEQYPSGIPRSIYPSYSELVDQCNLLVASHNANIARYNALYEDYSQRIERYNALVKEANATAKQIGGTWYIIPVPAPRYSRGRPAANPPR